jgi:hypothetical protein
MIRLLYLGAGKPPIQPPWEAQAVDNSRLFVDNWLSLWRSVFMAENEPQDPPPNVGGDSGLLRDVDWMRKRLLLWINLWVSLPDSFHREAGFYPRQKAQDLG